MTISIQKITEPPAAPPRGFALMDLGFRPLFLLAGLFAVASIGYWLFLLLGGGGVKSYYGITGWHSHEMIFGFTAAVISGFLLTAVSNWTSQSTLTGVPLALLSLLWVASRLLSFVALPVQIIALLDLLFLPLVALAIAIPIVRKRQWNNLQFVPLLLCYAAANLLVHLDLLGYAKGLAYYGNLLGIGSVVLVVTIVGGRVIGFFIERGIPGSTIRSWPWVERLAVASVLLLFAAQLTPVSAPLVPAIALLTLAIHTLRMAGWYHPQIRRVALLWVLYLGYGWIVIGFFLNGLASSGWVTPSLALHAYTVGGFGAMTLGMMARVSLGHTGRMMRVGRTMVIAFSLVHLATLFRLLPAIDPAGHMNYIMLSSLAWLVSFTIFFVIYAPVLWRPRVD